MPPNPQDPLPRECEDETAALGAAEGVKTASAGTAEFATVSYGTASSAEKTMAPGASEVEARAQGISVPGYEILGELGRGGMGIVYKARHCKLHRLVALKMILGGGHAGSAEMQRFLAEAEAIASLHHANIVQVYDVGQHEDLPYMALEFLEGGTLAQKLREHPLGPRAAARVVEPLARGVHAAHQAGIVHRDLKPANVLLAEDGTPKVTDFGLAKRVEGGSGLTQTGAVMGTPSYMAPEQASGEGKRVGPAADVYALGAILYDCLTGRPPFRAATPLETILQVVHEEPVAPRRLQANLPKDLETICLKCLHKEPARRYADAAALAEDLRRFLADEPIAARPVGRVERAWRWSKRNPARAIALLSILLVVIGAIVFPVWLAVAQTQNARALASEQGKTLLAMEELGKEQAKTLSALSKAQTAERSALRQAAESTFERALQMCEQGEVPRGLLWFARGLEMAEKADAPDLAEAFRWNLGAWGREVHHLQWLREFPRESWGLALHPDGESFVVCPEQRILFLRTSDGQPVRTPLDVPAPVIALRYSPDGKTLAVAANNDVDLYEIGEEIKKVRTLNVGGPLTHVVFDPTGAYIATGGRHRMVDIWEVASAAKRAGPLKHNHEIYGLAFNADGTRLVSGGENGGALTIHSVPDGAFVQRIPANGFLYGFGVSSQDKVVLAFGGGSYARQIDLRGVPVPVPNLDHANWVRAATYDADGQRILTGSDDRTARLWNAATGKLLGAPLAHRDPVIKVAFPATGDSVLTGTHKTLCRWKISPGQLVHSLPHPGIWVKGLAFTKDSRELITGGAKDRLDRWDVASGRRIDPPIMIVSKLGLGDANTMAVSPDGKTLYAPQHFSGTVAFLDTTSWQLLRQTGSHGDEVQRIVLSPDGRFFVTGGNNWRRTEAGRAARLWDALTAEPFGAMLQHNGPVLGIAVSPDSKQVLTGSNDGTVCLWDAQTGKLLLPPWKHTNEVWAVDFSPDGRLVVTAGADRSARLWEANTWKPVGAPMSMQGTIFHARFLAEGRLLATTGEDATARFWNVASCKPVGPLLRHGAHVHVMCISPDGKLLATGSNDYTAKIWRVPEPVAGASPEITRWVRTITGMDLDDQGHIQVLTAQAWHDLNAAAN